MFLNFPTTLQRELFCSNIHFKKKEFKNRLNFVLI